MTIRGPFEPEIDELPSQIPVFPLSGALLLPGSKLPLNIFEPRYLAMVRDTISTPLRLIGMIQPNMDEAGSGYYSTGCAGRISEFTEQEDGRILITLSGIIRFQAASFTTIEAGYMVANIDCSQYLDDRDIDESLINRVDLLSALRQYFDVKGFQVNWEQLEACSDERLIGTLSMICPFDAAEKQALLEAPRLSERAELLTAILQMACHDGEEQENAKH